MNDARLWGFLMSDPGMVGVSGPEGTGSSGAVVWSPCIFGRQSALSGQTARDGVGLYFARRIAHAQGNDPSDPLVRSHSNQDFTHTRHCRLAV